MNLRIYKIEWLIGNDPSQMGHSFRFLYPRVRIWWRKKWKEFIGEEISNKTICEGEKEQRCVEALIRCSHIARIICSLLIV